eukprot:5640190-Pleurochrysis_carterae.AAC.1
MSPSASAEAQNRHQHNRSEPHALVVVHAPSSSGSRHQQQLQCKLLAWLSAEERQYAKGDRCREGEAAWRKGQSRAGQVRALCPPTTSYKYAKDPSMCGE